MNVESNPSPMRGRVTSRSEWVIRLVILLGVLLVGAAGVGLLMNRPDAGAAVKILPPRVGAVMSDFRLENMQGGQGGLSDYRGKVVLINTWATWCPPCQMEMPALQAFYAQNRESGFVLLAINAGETREQAANFAEQYGLSFPILLDPQEQLMDALAIHDYPTSILVGADGLVKAVHIGLFTEDTLQQEIGPYVQR